MFAAGFASMCRKDAPAAGLPALRQHELMDLLV
jgi:hypothetical protein